MKRFWLGITLGTALAGCSGGNPFQTGTETETPETGIPDTISSDLDGITYDPVSQTLTVTGVTLDGTPIESAYRRRPGMDRNGYQAYTAQDGSLQQHSTAYVRDIGGTRAAVIVTGGQFEHYFAGAVYGRSGAFSAPLATSPGGRQVSYAGNYVGILNGPGDGGDLLPVTPGTPVEIRPGQAGEVTGRVLINANFDDNTVQGGIFERVYVDSPAILLSDLALQPSNIDPANGTFTGNVTINRQTKGDYGGIFGGANANTVAGAIFVSDHIDGVENEEEFGIFVLPKCQTPGEDALCNQPVP